MGGLQQPLTVGGALENLGTLNVINVISVDEAIALDASANVDGFELDGNFHLVPRR